MTTPPADDDPTLPWWAKPDFDTRLAAFNHVRKTLGDHDLSPALRVFFEQRELAEHLVASAIPPTKHKSS